MAQRSEPSTTPATSLTDAIPTGIAAVDIAGRQVYVNESFARMVGWPRDALLGATPPFVYWPQDQLPLIERAFQRTLRGDVPPEGFTLSFQRQDDSRIDVLLYLGPIGDAAQPEGWVASVIDISAHAALQRELARNEAKVRAAYAAEQTARHAAERSARRLEALQRATSEMTTMLTPREVAEVVMRAGIPALGGARGSVAIMSEDGRALEVIGAIGYSDNARERYRRVPMELAFPLTDAVREGRALLFPNFAAREARYPHLRDLMQENGAGAMASLPLVAAGRVLGGIGINWSDDHEFAPEETAFLESLAHQCAQALERARLHEEEQRARRDAEVANRTKSDFLAAMSHELRTPLNGIAGYVDLLVMGLRGPISDEQRADLERIRANATHLSVLIEDVLSFARIEAGKLEVERASVPMDATLRSLHPLVKPQLDAKGLRFAYDGCAADLAAVGDRERIVQICLNLLTNAVKATTRGGEVALTCVAEGELVLVQVADTGTGIPREMFETIFSPFTQLGRSLRSPQEGAGLGLSISRGLAEAMDGSLTVTSEVGVGSRFTLALRRDRDR
ncbi:MAG: ATP-binding region ATPase domain protein [Gemmatimonadetes bacterium]|nr:ATP-binding region ATPase domain protein [Gemmatimonadota bacterium]